MRFTDRLTFISNMFDVVCINVIQRRIIHNNAKYLCVYTISGKIQGAMQNLQITRTEAFVCRTQHDSDCKVRFMLRYASGDDVTPPHRRPHISQKNVPENKSVLTLACIDNRTQLPLKPHKMH